MNIANFAEGCGFKEALCILKFPLKFILSYFFDIFIDTDYFWK
jgi:hypothetical protein